MSLKDEKIVLYSEDIKKFNNGLVEDNLLNAIVNHLGIAIRSNDAERVSCSDESELDRVRESFLKKKLELKNSDDELNSAIKEICEQLGTSNKNKFRATFYYLLTKKFKADSIFV